MSDYASARRRAEEALAKWEDAERPGAPLSARSDSYDAAVRMSSALRDLLAERKADTVSDAARSRELAARLRRNAMATNYGDFLREVAEYLERDSGTKCAKCGCFPIEHSIVCPITNVAEPAAPITPICTLCTYGSPVGDSGLHALTNNVFVMCAKRLLSPVAVPATSPLPEAVREALGDPTCYRCGKPYPFRIGFCEKCWNSHVDAPPPTDEVREAAERLKSALALDHAKPKAYMAWPGAFVLPPNPVRESANALLAALDRAAGEEEADV